MMDRNAILAALSIPILLGIRGIWSLGRSSDGFGAIANGLFLFFAIAAAVVAALALYLLRSHELRWWHGLLISVGSILAVVIIVLVISWIQHLNAPVAGPAPDVSAAKGALAGP
jgi:hypothetical protein